MRIVIDTNVLLSALLWGGTPRLIIEALRSESAQLFVSEALLAEFDSVLARPKFAVIIQKTRKSPAGLSAALRTLAVTIVAPPLAKQVCRDANDDVVLACALAANADAIVTGDEDLLVLQSFQQIPIVTPVAMLALLAQRE